MSKTITASFKPYQNLAGYSIPGVYHLTYDQAQVVGTLFPGKSISMIKNMDYSMDMYAPDLLNLKGSGGVFFHAPIYTLATVNGVKVLEGANGMQMPATEGESYYVVTSPCAESISYPSFTSYFVTKTQAETLLEKMHAVFDQEFCAQNYGGEKVAEMMEGPKGLYVTITLEDAASDLGQVECDHV